MAAGRKSTSDGSFLTDRRTLRTVSAADSDVDSVEEVLDNRIDGTDNGNSRGHDTTIAIFVLLDGPSGATVQLWASGSEEEEGSSSSSLAGGEWCKYAEQAVTGNTLLVYSDMPAGEYKVVVSSITGAGDVVIREAHSG